MKNLVALRDAQKAGQNPGHAIGTFLLEHSNSTSYLISQLEAYLQAVKADQEANAKEYSILTKAVQRGFPEPLSC